MAFQMPPCKVIKDKARTLLNHLLPMTVPVYINTAIPVTIWQAQYLHPLIPICSPAEHTSDCLYYTISTHDKQIIKSVDFLNEFQVLVSTSLLFPLLSMCHVSQQQSSVVTEIPKNEKPNSVVYEI
jgi:hypothetical protein